MKKLLSCVTAVCLGASMAAPMVSNAIYCVHDANNPALNKFNDKEKYVEIDNRFKELIFITTGEVLNPWDDEEINEAVLYSDIGGNTIFALIPINLMGYGEDYVSVGFNLAEDAAVEQVGEVLGENFTVSNYVNSTNYKYLLKCPRADIKEICNILKENKLIESFVIPRGFVQITEYSTCTNNGFEYMVTEEEYKALEEYVVENNLGELVFLGENSKTWSTYKLDIDAIESVEEKYDVAFDIFKHTGVRASFTSPATLKKVGIGDVDVFNAMDGDANNDKITSIADAAAIMQAIGNPDKYALSEQGEFNADFACDGITVDDAVAIQKKLTELK
ncbi:MAG: hypothetical protein IJN43_04335 [Ruminococcus sp.]|nr:hypothetical protein [Ruminococcus sp.]